MLQDANCRLSGHQVGTSPIAHNGNLCTPKTRRKRRLSAAFASRCASRDLRACRGGQNPRCECGLRPRLRSTTQQSGGRRRSRRLRALRDSEERERHRSDASKRRRDANAYATRANANQQSKRWRRHVRYLLPRSAA